MQTITNIFDVYGFNELSENAKENAKRWYLDGQDSGIFTDMCDEDLSGLFPNSNLKVQYSLNSCQGDGFNIYGKISMSDLIEAVKEVLTEKEYKKASLYASICDDFELEYNNRYCYCIADRHDFYNDMIYDLENNYIKGIDKELLENLSKLFSKKLGWLCQNFEQDGYNFFYEIDEQDLAEVCEANGWLFYENGDFYS